jgi:hypothetical protein
VVCARDAAGQTGPANASVAKAAVGGVTAAGRVAVVQVDAGADVRVGNAARYADSASRSSVSRAGTVATYFSSRTMEKPRAR